MKTGSSKSKAEVGVFKDMNINSCSTKQSKKVALGIATEACGDKENLVQKCRLTHTSSDNLKQKLTEKCEDFTREKLVKKITQEDIPSQTEDTVKTVTAEDLTSDAAGPSEAFWEVIAERRRKALEETLNENTFLHEKIELLQRENDLLKRNLNEATDIIEGLKDILDGKEEPDLPDDVSVDLGLGDSQISDD